ncbi:MAG: hypothetical protein AAFQ63_18740 [Cyanobacteria bacterium J06621_11]
MPEPSLTDVFGAGATQDATTITIQKANLPGLTPATENSAESILAAIGVQAKTTLTQASFETNQDQSIVVADGFDSIVSRDDGSGTLVSYRQQQLTFSFHKLDAGTFNPDDY